ncbi:T9SS type A sorting domain-containing protein [Kordia sp.]|uniref:T9SS type A sorting domain-containing protein n=1 Tax=Kordia sp. TaxID=1965332 RepID=UPI0025C063DC|nr:T9SS type A sorting domain-containing protein [Kordia sp.]MCH2194364.1 T9SS type A sorting domain-containing protein [Kordia sp.]
MKTKVLIFLLLLHYSFSFGQLHIENNNTLYVQNQVVFVENNVDIESGSAISLRDEAQLIQGNSGTSTNLGSGYLSVFQEGINSPYHYNYWCAPVGDFSTNSSGNQNFSVNMMRDEFGTSALFTNSYEGVSSPLTISSQWLYTYDNGTVYADWDAINESTNINPGVGFTMKGTNAVTNQRYEYRGKPNNGTINLSVLANQNRLIGNPYPSALDADQFILDNAATITGELFFWDQWGTGSHYLSDYEGNYATYTSSGLGMGTGIAATTPTTDYGAGGINSTNTDIKTPKRYIPIAQGFMVEGNATGGTVVIQNSQRPKLPETFQSDYKENAGDSDFFSPSNNINYYLGKAFRFPTFIFKISVEDTYDRRLMLVLRDDANSSAEYGKDAKASETLTSDVTWLIENESFIIQSDKFSIDKKLPLVFDIGILNDFSFSLEATEFTDNLDIRVFLHDKETGQYYEFTSFDDKFDFTLPAGRISERFEITFSEEVLSVDDTKIQSLTIFQNNASQILNILNPNRMELKSVTMHDILGKKLWTKKISGNQETISMDTSTLSDGIYIVSVLSQENQVLTKKVTVTN